MSKRTASEMIDVVLIERNKYDFIVKEVDTDTHYIVYEKPRGTIFWWYVADFFPGEDFYLHRTRKSLIDPQRSAFDTFVAAGLNLVEEPTEASYRGARYIPLIQ